MESNPPNERSHPDTDLIPTTDPGSDATATPLPTHHHRGRRRTQLSTRIQHKAETFNQKIPYLRNLPGPAIAIILLLLLINVVVWAIIAIVLQRHPGLIWTSFLAWTLGLRHALDADHISCIDLMTRRLVASGQKPVTVGTFFSLGHSTIVVVTCIVVAASSAAIESKFGDFSKIGGIIGSSVSAAFLLFLGTINIYILHKLYQQLTHLLSLHGSSPAPQPIDFQWQGRGCMTVILRKLFQIVDKPWKMYPIGVIFGLGFDTSSEVALLGIASIEAAKGTSFWLILVFPVLFTAGMCLVDTFDGAAMMSLYTSARLAKDLIAVLYYQCVLTAITVVVAVAIGILQLLCMVQSIKPNLRGAFWHGVSEAGNNYDIIGACICASFIVLGSLSVVLYKPWRRWVEGRRAVRDSELEGSAGESGKGPELHGAPEELIELGSRGEHVLNESVEPPQGSEKKALVRERVVTVGESSQGTPGLADGSEI